MAERSLSLSLRVGERERERERVREREMEGGKRGAEAGQSSGSGVKDEQRENHKEMSENPSGVCELRQVEEEEEEDGVDESKGVSGFVPGPLLSLKEQIEKDKVFFFLPLMSASLLFSFFSFLNFGLSLREKTGS